MERKLNPDIHIICGKCGCSTMFEFELILDGNDVDDKIYPAIFMVCNNCKTLTSLDDTIVDKTDWDKLKLTKKY